MYAYKTKGEWVFPVNMKSRHNGIGGWHLLTDAQRAEYEWYPLVLVNDTVPYGKVKQTFPKVELLNGVVTVTYALLDVDINTLRADKLIALDSKALEVENQGVAVNGALIASDRASVARNTSALSMMSRNPTVTINFETKGGWAVADKALMEAVEDALWQHTSDTNDNKKSHFDAIALLTTPEEIGDYDISIGW